MTIFNGSQVVSAIIPSVELVQNLEAGDTVLDCFGNLADVAEITFRGVDLAGKAFVGFTTRLSDTSTCSHTYKAGRLVRTVKLTGMFTSHELDKLEADMLAKGDNARGILRH